MRRESGSADELDEEGSELASRTFIDTRVAFDGSEMYWGVSSTLVGGAPAAEFVTLDEVSEGFEGGSVSGIASVTGFDTGATSGTVASVLMGKFWPTVWFGGNLKLIVLKLCHNASVVGNAEK